MGATTQLLNRQGVMAPGQTFDTGPQQVAPIVPLGQGTKTPAAMRDIRLFIASDVAGSMQVWQAQDFATINTFPTPPAGRVAVTPIAYAPGAGLVAQVTVSAPYVRMKYTNGGVAATFADMWAAVTED